MASFGERLKEEMDRQHLSQADVCKGTGLKSGHVSPYLNGKPNRDPQLSTAAKIAQFLNVSLDYLAGLTDNPAGMCAEEIKGLRIDAEARTLLRGFDQLTPEGKHVIVEQVDFQLSKNRAQGPDSAVCEVA